MQDIPIRSVRRQLTREAGATWTPLPMFARPGLSRVAIRGLIKSARRVDKRIATCPRSKLPQLKELREQWLQHAHKQHRDPLDRYLARRNAEAFEWLFSIPEIHAMAEGE